jgi:hypothetical protein
MKHKLLALYIEVVSKKMKKHASKLITSFKKVDGEFGVSTLLNEDHEFTALIRVQEKSM